MKPYCLFFSALMAVFLAGCGSQQEAEPAPVVEVSVAKAHTEDVQLTVSAPATIFGQQQAGICSRITAPIRRLLVRKGDKVQSGQIIAELDDRDLVAQREEAASAVVEAEANLQRIMLATLPTDIEKARGQLTIAEAALNQAQKFYDRRKQLFEQGAIPQRDLLVSETDLAQARANYEVARRSLELLQSQSQEKEVLAAKSKVQQARAHLELIETQLGFTRITSPFSGSVTEQYMFAGDMAKPDAPIVTVMNLDRAVARAQVPDEEASGVHAGAYCSFTPSDGVGASFPGRVSVVNQAVDPARRTVEVWCEIPNSDGRLRAGAFGHAVLVTGVARGSVVVPLSAVQIVEGSHRGWVMLAGDKGTAIKREVETGEIFNGKVQIKSGVSAGDPVIVEGVYGLTEGTQIRLKEGKLK